MDPFATMARFALTLRHEHEERNELAEAFKGWIDSGGFVPTVRHKNDDGNGYPFRVKGLYARGVHTYFVTPDAQDDLLLASKYVAVVPRR